MFQYIGTRCKPCVVGQPNYAVLKKSLKKIWSIQKKYIYLHRQFKIIKNMKKKTTRYSCLLAISRFSAILVNVFNDRVISIYSTDSYLSVKLSGIVTDEDVHKFNLCFRSVFSDFPKFPVWSINAQNDKDFPLDFSKVNSSFQLSLPSVIENI